MTGCTHSKHFETTLVEFSLHEIGHVATVWYIDLVEGHNPRPVFQSAVRRQLGLDHIQIRERIPPRLHRGQIDDMNQRGAAFDMPQKVVAEATAFTGPLDQPGHIGDGERDITRPDDTKVRHQRGERVVGNLGPSPAQGGDQRRLACAREADQTDVGNNLEFQPDDQVFAGLTKQGEPGCLALGTRQRRVAQPATPALGDHHLSACADHVGQHLPALVGHDRPVRDRQNQVVAMRTIAVAASAMAAVLGSAYAAKVVVDQRGHIRIDPQDHRSTWAAVAAIRPTQRFELLAVHRRDAVATAPGDDLERHLVHEGRNGHRFGPLSFS